MSSSSQKNIYLIGPMGAGKTTIGRCLAKELGMAFYDSDQVIEERTGVDIPWIFDLVGEDGFRKWEIEIIAELTKIPGIVLATGGTAVAAAENIKALKNGIVVYLKTSRDNQMSRTKRSKKRPIPTAASDRQATLDELRDKYGKVYEGLADLVYNTDSYSIAGVVNAIISKIS